MDEKLRRAVLRHDERTAAVGSTELGGMRTGNDAIRLQFSGLGLELEDVHELAVRVRQSAVLAIEAGLSDAKAALDGALCTGLAVGLYLADERQRAGEAVLDA